MKKYYVYYVDNSSPFLKKFKTLKAAKAFANKFKKEYPDPYQGYWVEFIVAGEILDAEEYHLDQL